MLRTYDEVKSTPLFELEDPIDETDENELVYWDSLFALVADEVDRAATRHSGGTEVS